MKVIIFSISMAILVTVLCFVAIDYLESSSMQFVQMLGKVDNAIVEKNWETAESNLDLFKEKWSKNIIWWNLLIEHREIDNMEISLNRIKSYLNTKSVVDAKAEIATLIKYIQHIPESERLTFENTF